MKANNLFFIFTIIIYCSCQTKPTSTEKPIQSKNKKDTLLTKVNPKIFTGKQLDSIQNIYSDSILVSSIMELFNVNFYLINDYAKISYSTMDLNNDSLPDRIITFEGDFDIGHCINHIILLNKKNYYLNAGSVTQAQHDGPIDFEPIHLDKNNSNYFLANSQGWGSGFYSINNEIYQIENDTIKNMFFYPTHSSYVLDFGNYPPMEVLECRHKFLNDSVLQLDLDLYFMAARGDNLKSRTFKETVKMIKVRNGEEMNSFKVIESTNPEFIKEEIFPPMSLFYLYGNKLTHPYFKEAWEEFNSIE